MKLLTEHDCQADELEAGSIGHMVWLPLHRPGPALPFLLHHSLDLLLLFRRHRALRSRHPCTLFQFFCLTCSYTAATTGFSVAVPSTAALSFFLFSTAAPATAVAGVGTVAARGVAIP